MSHTFRSETAHFLYLACEYLCVRCHNHLPLSATAITVPCHILLDLRSGEALKYARHACIDAWLCCQHVKEVRWQGGQDNDQNNEEEEEEG